MIFKMNVNHSYLTSDCFLKITTISSQTFSAPSIIPSFKVMSIETTSVKLCWEPFPLSKQEGLVLLYQIGGDKKGNGNYYYYNYYYYGKLKKL